MRRRRRGGCWKGVSLSPPGKGCDSPLPRKFLIILDMAYFYAHLRYSDVLILTYMLYNVKLNKYV